MQAARPATLFVDLDGTLIRSDLLWEAFVRLVRRSPWSVLMLPFWLLRGRAAFKRTLSERVSIDASVLPYRSSVVTYIEEQRSQGCHIVLATASDERWAHAVAERLGVFDAVLASDGTHNLKGAAKLAAIESYCETREGPSWGYIGDAAADLPIWSKADDVLVVEPPSGLLSRIRAIKAPAQVFDGSPARARAAIRAIRPHQWVKNVLLFVPLVLARNFTDMLQLATVGAAFVAFSLCASAVYVFNDLLDIEADRAHKRKCKRPFAAGALPLWYGPMMAIALIASALAITVLVLPH